MESWEVFHEYLVTWGKDDNWQCPLTIIKLASRKLIFKTSRKFYLFWNGIQEIAKVFCYESLKLYGKAFGLEGAFEALYYQYL